MLGKAVCGDIIILTDVDEIPDPRAIQEFMDVHKQVAANISMDMYYNYLNLKVADKWVPPKIFKYEYCTDNSLKTMDDIRIGGLLFTLYGGWHFSYVGGAETVLAKLGGF